MPETPNRYARRGGRNDIRNRVYSSAAWRKVRLEVIARDGHQCRGRGPHRGSLTVHHVVAVALAPELALAPDNLLTLCARCHGKLDGPRAPRPLPRRRSRNSRVADVIAKGGASKTRAGGAARAGAGSREFAVQGKSAGWETVA